MSTASDEAAAVETSEGTGTYCLKRSLKLSTVGDNISTGFMIDVHAGPFRRNGPETLVE